MATACSDENGSQIDSLCAESSNQSNGKDCLAESDSDTVENKKRWLIEEFSALTLSEKAPGSSSVTSSAKDSSALKESIRLKMWDFMEARDLVKDFPRPCHQRVPHFKGCARAAEKVSRLREFRHARSVKINPSLAQMHLRFLSLKYGKILYVASPSLETDFLHILDPSQLTRFWQLKRGSSKAGAAELGSPVNLDSNLKIDLVIVASVACARNGVRLGKGQGYAELEWALFVTMGAVTKDTIVVTTVHDCQVLSNDELPVSIMSEHDLPVDIIVTPTRIINVKPKLPKPMCGVIWELLSDDRLQTMPILQNLKKRQLSSSAS